MRVAKQSAKPVRRQPQRSWRAGGRDEARV